MALWPSAAANAQTTLASCSPTSSQTGVTVGGQEIAQTFTVSADARVEAIQLELWRANPSTTGNFVVQISAADASGPTGAPLSTGSIAATSTPTSPPVDPVTVSLSPAVLLAGQQYAFAISLVGPGEGAVDADFNDPCTGQMFARGSSSAAWLATGADVFFTLLGTSPPPFESPAPELQPSPKADGTLTIDANKGKVEKGRKVTLSGQLDVASNESCEQNRPIQIQRRLKSEDDTMFQTFTTVQTDATGNYTLKTKVKKTYFYRAVVGETEACDDETSNSQKVRVQKKQAAQEA